MDHIRDTEKLWSRGWLICKEGELKRGLFWGNMSSVIQTHAALCASVWLGLEPHPTCKNRMDPNLQHRANHCNGDNSGNGETTLLNTLDQKWLPFHCSNSSWFLDSQKQASCSANKLGLVKESQNVRFHCVRQNSISCTYVYCTYCGALLHVKDAARWY